VSGFELDVGLDANDDVPGGAKHVEAREGNHSRGVSTSRGKLFTW